MAGRAAPAKIRGGGYHLDRVQDFLAEALRRNAAVEITQGVLVTVTFTAATLAQNVPHRLGRRVRGFVLVRSVPPTPGASPSVIEDTTVAAPPDPTEYVRLVASAATTASLWMF